MIFVFDLDDTVCDTDKYSEYYIRDFFLTHNLNYKQIVKDTRFAEEKFDWDRETALNWYKEYGDEMMLYFPCKPNAIEVINKLHDLGHKVVIATARARDWHNDPEEVTISWLKNNNIKYDDIYIGRIDKEKICEEVNANIFIDDDIKITSRVAKYFKDNNVNGKSFLMTTSYNKDLQVGDGVIRVTDFKDFARKLKNIGIDIYLDKKISR